VIGPGTPTRDEFDRPLSGPALRRVGRLKPGSLDDVPGLAADLAALAGDQDPSWTVERPATVHAFAHADPGGRVRAVLVASDAERPVTATLLADAALHDPFTGETILPQDGRAAIPLSARGVRLLVVQR
jgi:hypothetical protein